MEFEEWSNKQKERQGFENWSDEKKAAAQNNLDSVGKMYGLHPGVGEVEKAAQSQTSAPETPAQKPYTPSGQSARLGETNAPTKTFTFSQSPKAEVPANRFSGEGAFPVATKAFRSVGSAPSEIPKSLPLARLPSSATGSGRLAPPGFEARTGMSAHELAGNPLAATSSGEYTNNWNNKEPKSSGADYLDRSVNQVILGNLTDDTTLLGTAAQVGLGIAGLDLPMDIRDLTYDLTNWKWTPEHIAQTLLDAVGFIPVIGSLKYADEFAAVLKNADEVARLAREAPELVDAARAVGKLDDVLGSVDEFGELLESAPKVAGLLENADEAANLLDSTDEIIIGNGTHIKPDELTSIYRAVGPEEYYNVLSSGKFDTVPTGMEVKQFGLNKQDTINFAERYPNIAAILEVKIPKGILNNIGDFTEVDTTIFKNGTVTIQPENLNTFNKFIKDIFHIY